MHFRCTELEFGSNEQRDSIVLREAVLRTPLGLSFTHEELQAERNQRHLAALNEQGEVLGILLLKPLDSITLKMRQVAVREDVRGLGIGAELVRFAEGLSLSEGIEFITLHARENVVPFYRALGYVVCSEPFEEVGIPHVEMYKELGSENMAHQVSD